MLRRHALLALVLTLLVGTPLTAQLPWSDPWDRGDLIEIEGHVTDREGKPLAGVHVLFEAARDGFRLRTFERETRDRLQMPVRSREDGSFSFTWSWDPYYNTFSLAAGLPVEGADGTSTFELYTRRDITAEVEAGTTPVTLPLTVENGQSLAWLQRYLDEGGSPDQDRIFGEIGRPDRIDSRTRTDGVEEVSWWYFPRGAVYRFENGRLDGVTHFDPVQ